MPSLHRMLLRWYAAEHRPLPWRATADPYAILVSEVMLQQTQVVRVLPRYTAWLERWPDEHALAAAPVADVLAAWVGLGYNARALRLHAAAGAVASGGWPRTAAGLRALPGVGPYTAAAVASFAFGEQIAAVDVNVARVAGRLGRGDAASLLAPGEAATWNQAMIELGATVCRARGPRCEVCPLAAVCASAGRVAAPAAGPPRPRFQDTARWVRGRVVAALAAGEPVPQDIAPDRLAPALAALQRDGLIERGPHGWRLPAEGMVGAAVGLD